MATRLIVALLVLIFTLPLKVRAEENFTVYTTNYPLTYFAERIGGGHVNVIFPVPSDVDPAFWTPDSATVRKYQQADLIILNGAVYEKWTRKVSLPILRIVDTSRAFKENLIHLESTVTHSHGTGGDHSHGGIAFTTWLDFSQAAQQAEAIVKSFIRKAPEHRKIFTDNFADLKKDLLQLDEQIQAITAHKGHQPLMASHPIYQYFARRYNLNLKMVMWEPDMDPGSGEWQNLAKQLGKDPAEWMLWEGAPLTDSVVRLKSMGVNSAVFSPCFSRPEQGDFLSVMRQNVKNLEDIFR
jgi:zinc transport system substrate-binding protein